MNRLRALVFVGGFLLFALELLIGRVLLPTSGGASHVWATTLMFYQGALFLAYAYCYGLAPRIGRWHLLIAGLGLLFLPLWVHVEPDPAAPITPLLLGLVRWVALPFGVLATTSVIAQQWLVTTDISGERTPYTLYAASNAGALVALLAYPLVIERSIGLHTQSLLWSAGFVGYLALLWYAHRLTDAQPAAVAPATALEPGAADSGISGARFVYWLLLAAGPSAMLLAGTNEITLDLGSAPLLWVAPLFVYLASFVLVFREQPWVPGLVRRYWLELSLVGIFYQGRGEQSLGVLVHLAIVFAIALVAHDALFQSRPHRRHLAVFYLAVALGGWLGAAFVALVAPSVFTEFTEYPIAIALVAGTLLVGRRTAFWAWLRAEPPVLLVASVVFFAVVGKAFVDRGATTHTESIAQLRTAYGVYSVRERGDARVLWHGTTKHGLQGVTPLGRLSAAGYYASESPLGEAVRLAPSPHKMVVIGLGAGATAALMKAGDEVTFVELDPGVISLAQTYFTYLDDTAATCRVEAGDARLWLEEDEDLDGTLDLVVVDAFTSDAVPSHLLTEEALALYARKLAPGGRILLHISNRHYDLASVLLATGRAADLHGARKTRLPPLGDLEWPSTWYALVPDPTDLEPLVELGWFLAATDPELRQLRPWSDDRVDLLGAMHKRWADPFELAPKD